MSPCGLPARWRVRYVLGVMAGALRGSYAALFVAALLGATAPPGPGRATVFVPMTVEALAASSDGVALARVERTQVGVGASGRIVTRVELRVLAPLRGAPPAPGLLLEEPGGTLGDRHEVVFGAPVYRTGETVVVFLHRAADGSWRTNQLALGMLSVERRDGELWAVRHPPADALVLPSPPGAADALPLADLVARLGGDPDTLPELVLDASLVAAPFTLLGNARFFEPDVDEALALLVDSRGDSIVGLEVIRRALDQALAVWTDLPQATVALSDAGLVADTSAPCEAGRHRVVFDDPGNEIPPPSQCTGTLAVAGFCSTSADQKHFSGMTFDRALRALVTFADGWDRCPEWNECNLAEIATHEVGHAIGLGHSSENLSEADPLLSDATMYFLAHFDGRCAAVRSDDVAGVTFLYPSPPPPSILTEALPDATVGQPYAQPLTAVGGSGGFVWSEAPGNCPSFPGLAVGADGMISGSPTAFGTGCFDVVATDASGDSHRRRLDITVVRPGATSTPTRTATLPPPATATQTVTPREPTPTATSGGTTPTANQTPTVNETPAADCVGDCNGDGQVAINELIVGVNIALGSAPPSACPSIDRNGDGTAAVNELIGAVNASLAGCPA